MTDPSKCSTQQRKREEEPWVVEYFIDYFPDQLLLIPEGDPHARPDFLVQGSDRKIGVEVTEAVFDKAREHMSQHDELIRLAEEAYNAVLSGSTKDPSLHPKGMVLFHYSHRNGGRLNLNKNAKRAIARKIAELIYDDSALLMSDGTMDSH